MMEFPNIKRMVAVASGKGGVGKSTTAMNLATALAVAGHKVGLLDADVYGPSLPHMLGVQSAVPAGDGERIDPIVAHGLKMMSMGLLVDDGAPTVWRGPMVQKAILQMLQHVNWGELDVLIIDMPPGTGDAQLAVSQQLALNGAIIVSTPQDIALLDANKALEAFNKLNIPVLGIVENMSGFACPHCGEVTPIFSQGGAANAAQAEGVEFLAALPLDLTIREKTDAGQPLVISQPDHAAAKIYRELAEKVWDKISQAAITPKKVVIE